MKFKLRVSELYVHHREVEIEAADKLEAFNKSLHSTEWEDYDIEYKETVDGVHLVDENGCRIELYEDDNNDDNKESNM